MTKITKIKNSKKGQTGITTKIIIALAILLIFIAFFIALKDEIISLLDNFF